MTEEPIPVYCLKGNVHYMQRTRLRKERIVQSSTSLVKQVAKPRRQVMPVLEQERQIMTVGEENRWPFRVLGVAPAPQAPVYFQKWWLVPITQDESEIPERALNRVQAIFEAGIRPKAFVLAHEAPAQLKPPADVPTMSRVEFVARQLAQHSWSTVKVVGKVAVVAVPIAAAALGALGLATLGIVGAVLTADPCLIVVTEDDVWIQIDYWLA